VYNPPVYSVSSSELAGFLAIPNGPFTVFAPTNEAFDSLPNILSQCLRAPGSGDFHASNGVIHAIPKVLSPPSVSIADLFALCQKTVQKAPEGIVGQAASSPSYTGVTAVFGTVQVLRCGGLSTIWVLVLLLSETSRHRLR
jgi:Fasciclin domain